MEEKPREVYIGDGVYVRIEHGTIWLRTPRENGDHEIALEPDVLANFIELLKSPYAAAQEATFPGDRA